MVENPYLRTTFFRAAADFDLDPQYNSAYISSGSAVRNFDTSLIGKEFRSITIMSVGKQIMEKQCESHPLSEYMIVASRTAEGPLHHYIWTQGKLSEKSLISISRQCPGVDFELDCGCFQKTERIAHTLFSQDADSAVWILLDQMTPKKQRNIIVKDSLEAVGIQNPKYVFRSERFEDDCLTQVQLDKNRYIRSVYFDEHDTPYFWVNDIPVTYRNGKNGRVLVFEEKPAGDKKGFGQVTRVHEVFIIGNPESKTPVVRYHSSCITSQYGGNGCDCRDELARTIDQMTTYDSGILIVAKEEGMGLGAVAKAHQTWDTLAGNLDLLSSREINLRIPEDTRRYVLPEFVLKKTFGIDKVIFASNNIDKKNALEQKGIEVIQINSLKINYHKLSVQAKKDADAKVTSGRYNEFTK